MKEEERTNKQTHRITNKNLTSDISSVLSSSPRTQEGGSGTFLFQTALADGVRKKRKTEKETERKNKQTNTRTKNKNLTSDIFSVLSSSPRTHEGDSISFPFWTALAIIFRKEIETEKERTKRNQSERKI
jgi:hypothetical protein